MKKIILILASLGFTACILFQNSAASAAAKSADNTSSNFSIGARVYSNVTPAQIDFINTHYNYVMTPVLDPKMRSSIQNPDLILYRSIQGTWEGFNHFDWEHIDSHENMFLHHNEERILTIWDSWLMDPGDFVNPDSPDALDHWINYYAVTAAEQIYANDYDGLFIDSASHLLNPNAVSGKMPDDYIEGEWYQNRYDSLTFIKSYLPDKSVMFNGLHSGGGAEDSLANTDGGMWETFAFQPTTGHYLGIKNWFEAIDLIDRQHSTKTISLITKKPGLTNDIQARTFVTASYLLVSHPNVILSMVDTQDNLPTSIYYYPEYTLDMGIPLEKFTIVGQSYASRQFENGFVIVNPQSDQTVKFALDSDYLKVISLGGGLLQDDGTWEGKLLYEQVSGEIELPPISGVILMNP